MAESKRKTAANTTAAQNIDLEMFIETVRKYPQLYDKKNEHYKDTIMKKTIWAAIGSIFGLNGIEAEKKWTVQRDRYTRELKKVRDKKVSGSGTSDQYCPTWKLYKVLDGILSPCTSQNETTFTNMFLSGEDIELDDTFPQQVHEVQPTECLYNDDDNEHDDISNQSTSTNSNAEIRKLSVKPTEKKAKYMEYVDDEHDDVSIQSASTSSNTGERKFIVKPTEKKGKNKEKKAALAAPLEEALMQINNTSSTLCSFLTSKSSCSAPPDVLQHFVSYLHIRLKNLDNQDRRSAMREIEEIMMKKEDHLKYSENF